MILSLHSHQVEPFLKTGKNQVGHTISRSSCLTWSDVLTVMVSTESDVTILFCIQANSRSKRTTRVFKLIFKSHLMSALQQWHILYATINATVLKPTNITWFQNGSTVKLILSSEQVVFTMWKVGQKEFTIEHWVLITWYTKLWCSQTMFFFVGLFHQLALCFANKFKLVQTPDFKCHTFY